MAVFPSTGPVEGHWGETLGGGGVEDGLSHPIFITSPSLSSSDPYSQLFPNFHQGESSPWGGSFVDRQGSGQACSPLSLLLQPSFRVEGNGLVEASDTPVTSQPLCSYYLVQDVDQPVGPLCGAEGQLDVLHQSQGCVSAGSVPSRQLSLPLVRC